MNKNTEVKTNRYTILDAEIKRLSADLKAKKREMLDAIKKLEADYREYRKTVYAPARKAAFDLFKASKVVGVKKVEKTVETDEKPVKSAKKVAKKSAKKSEKKTAKKVAKPAAAEVEVAAEA
jgi:hypothetical protein